MTYIAVEDRGFPRTKNKLHTRRHRLRRSKQARVQRAIARRAARSEGFAIRKLAAGSLNRELSRFWG